MPDPHQHNGPRPGGQQAQQAQQQQAQAQQQNQAAEQGVQEPPAALSEVIMVLLAGLAFYLTWVSFVVALACQAPHTFRAGLIFAFAWQCSLLIMNAVLYFLKHRQETPFITDVALTIFWLVFLATTEVHGEVHKAGTNKYFNVSLHAWLAFVMLGSMAVRYPFIIQYAKEAAPPDAWRASTFISLCDQLSGCWGVGQAFCCLLCLIPLLKDGNARNGGPSNIMCNYVVPYIILVTLMVQTRVYPRFVLERYYLRTAPPANGGGGGGNNNNGKAAPMPPPPQQQPYSHNHHQYSRRGPIPPPPAPVMPPSPAELHQKLMSQQYNDKFSGGQYNGSPPQQHHNPMQYNGHTPQYMGAGANGGGNGGHSFGASQYNGGGGQYNNGGGGQYNGGGGGGGQYNGGSNGGMQQYHSNGGGGSQPVYNSMLSGTGMPPYNGGGGGGGGGGGNGGVGMQNPVSGLQSSPSMASTQGYAPPLSPPNGRFSQQSPPDNNNSNGGAPPPFIKSISSRSSFAGSLSSPTPMQTSQTSLPLPQGGYGGQQVPRRTSYTGSGNVQPAPAGTPYNGGGGANTPSPSSGHGTPQWSQSPSPGGPQYSTPPPAGQWGDPRPPSADPSAASPYTASYGGLPRPPSGGASGAAAAAAAAAAAGGGGGGGGGGAAGMGDRVAGMGGDGWRSKAPPGVDVSATFGGVMLHSQPQPSPPTPGNVSYDTLPSPRAPAPPLLSPQAQRQAPAPQQQHAMNMVSGVAGPNLNSSMGQTQPPRRRLPPSFEPGPTGQVRTQQGGWGAEAPAAAAATAAAFHTAVEPPSPVPRPVTRSAFGGQDGGF